VLNSSLSFVASSDPPFQHTANVHAEHKVSIKGTDLLIPLQNSAVFVVTGAGWLLNFADLLGLESENTLQSQQGWYYVPGHLKAWRLPWHPDTKIIPYECHWGL
jgi:hypothetical protein